MPEPEDKQAQIIGRSEELDQLCHQILRSRSAQRPFVWITGDSGCGKTTLVEEGLIPLFSQQLGPAFTSTKIIPHRGEQVLDFVLRLVEALIKPTSSAPDKTRSQGTMTVTSVQSRINQFTLLLEEDPAEACEYLEAYVKQAALRHAGEHRHLIFIDGFDRLCPDGLLAPPLNHDWYSEALTPLVQFLQQLTWQTLFLIVTTLRTPNVESFRNVLNPHLRQQPGSWIPLKPMTSMKSGDFPAAWKFLEPPLQSTEESRSAPLTGPARWAESAEKAFAAYLRDDKETSLDRLFRLLDEIPDQSISCLDLAKRSPETRRLADHFIDAQVIQLTGETPETASFAWSLPDGLLAWDRFRHWQNAKLTLDKELEKLEAKRQSWEANEESQVLLIHASKLLERAIVLLERHDWHPFLPPALERYLRESVSLREQLTP
ncbi:MAG TPA: ATP-binding protein [Verrucomicrobiales bacterium]|nr:ATP-binding protein [Verrucomicrobiales bacterium]